VKTLLTFLVIAALCSCSKHQEIVTPEKQLSITTFNSMLTKDKMYVVSGYYTTDSTLAVPVVNIDDTYTFDGASNDGWISSKFPCIEYHYNFRVFARGDDILLDWLNFSIAPETFTVSDYLEDEWFILKNGDTYTKYVLVHDNQ
jgi:hypothetical protein